MMLAASARAWIAATTCALALYAGTASAAGVPAGTVIENTATVRFEVAGTPITLDTTTAAITVAERIDFVVTGQSPQLVVQPGETNRSLLFRVTNVGNGSETLELSVDSSGIQGSDFDPLPASTPVFFDSDGSGDLSGGDTAYQPGINDPVLAADESVDILVVNDIPNNVANGDIGLTELIAASTNGTGVPGSSLPGQGDGGSDAVFGVSGGSASATGEYRVSDIEITMVKSQVVEDPDGGDEPVPGATITYTITVAVTSAGAASVATVRDPIPQYTSYNPGTMLLNGVSLTDESDADAGEIEAGGAGTVVVRLGSLTQADGVQTVEFSVTID